MAHIDLMNEYPGIRGPMAFRPETAKPLNDLAEILLRGENTLTRGERELIGSYVSYLNGCFYCQHAHGSLAQHYLGCDVAFIERVKDDYRKADLPAKLKALLSIAGSVQKGGQEVTPDQIGEARNQGATDREIHDTVLIAAAFCMFNRYVDGLATWSPEDEEYYVERAPRRAEEGYANYDPKN